MSERLCEECGSEIIIAHVVPGHDGLAGKWIPLDAHLSVVERGAVRYKTWKQSEGRPRKDGPWVCRARRGEMGHRLHHCSG